MKRVLIFGIGIIVVLVVIIIGVMLMSHHSSSVTQTTTSNPFGFANNDSNVNTASSTQTNANTIVLQTTSSSTIVTPDFTSGKSSVPVGTTSNDVQYNLTPYPPYTPGKTFTTHQYDIQFNKSNSEFVVTLNQEPIGETRIAAENYLSSLLKLSNAQLCNLNIDVSVTSDVNEEYSQYNNLGLSFCPGSVELPQ